MADSLPLLLALELFDDSEVKKSGVLGKNDDITFFSVASSCMLRNRVRDYFEGMIYLINILVLWPFKLKKE